MKARAQAGIAWMLGMLSGIGPGAALAQDVHVALLKNLTGAVTIERQGTRLPADTGMRLFESDRILTEAGASAGLVFRDGTLLSVGPASDVVIRDYAFEPGADEFAFDLYLARGTALYSSGKIGKLAPQAVDVATPRATVGVRGTRFIVSAEP